MGKRKVQGEGCSIDITDTAPTTKGQSTDEVIDLAGDSPPITSGNNTHKSSHIIDLDSARNSPTPQEQRQKIMTHAALINSRKRPKAAETQDPGARSWSQDANSKQTLQAQGSSAVSDDCDAAKDAIMKHAAQLAPNNSLLAQLHAERLARQQLANPQHQEDCSAQKHVPEQEPLSELSLLTYNVWFEEAVALQQRMSAIGNIIQEHGLPHFICFQEVTPRIYHLFQQSPWWHRYTASQQWPQPYFTVLLYRKDVFRPAESFLVHPFANSAMGRSVLSIKGAVQGCSFRIATSHLESPCGHNQMFSKERVLQCHEGFEMLDSQDQTDVVWAGDMNWNADDGKPPLPAGWGDIWDQLKPRDPGLTYDGKRNPMLGPYNRLKSRLDRVYCKTCRYKPNSIKLVGTQPLPGVTFTKSYKKGPTQLPVLPSDHFGLLATLKYAS